MTPFLKLTPEIAKRTYHGRQYGNNWSFQTPECQATDWNPKFIESEPFEPGLVQFPDGSFMIKTLVEGVKIKNAR